MHALVAGLGAPELIIILAVVVLMFGAAKLPELARGSGRALRIFKAETKGLMDDDERSPDGPVDPAALAARQDAIDHERVIVDRALDEEQAQVDAARTPRGHGSDAGR